MQLPWYVAAVGAAIVWGAHYSLVDNALRQLSPASVLLLTALPIVLVVPVYHRALAVDLAVFRQMDWDAKAAVLAIAVTSLAGTVFLYWSIGGKNATLASLIEISYPVFVVLFTYGNSE